MTRRTVDRWLGAGVLLVIAVTAITAWRVQQQVQRAPAMAGIPAAAQATAYREVETIPVTVQQPTALTTGFGMVYIAGQHAIQRHRRTGRRMAA
ncbi:MAG TPA: hypothetical protein PLZ36_13320, partial [Armatimonadota bacterium]|nr:hypothetical protein [Armatimonadota bacterium]